MVTSLMDNDVLHKTVIYGLFDRILKASPAQNEAYGILGTAKYVVGKKLKKRPPSQRTIEDVIADFNAALQCLIELEPTPEEVEVAASFEYEAQCLNLELDGGESILCAIFLSRQLNHLLTGDKRAIEAIENLTNNQKISSEIAAKIICLEQLFIWLVNEHGPHYVRNAVCTEKGVDIVLTGCFSCYSPEVASEACIEGLKSYIDALRQAAPTVLAHD